MASVIYLTLRVKKSNLSTLSCWSLSMLYALAFLLIFVPLTILFSLMAIIGSLFDSTGRIAHWCAKQWSRTGLFLAGVKLEVSGQEKIPLGPVIFMGNHQGNFDILALYHAIPSQLAWMAKEELFRIPIF